MWRPVEVRSNTGSEGRVCEISQFPPSKHASVYHMIIHHCVSRYVLPYISSRSSSWHRAYAKRVTTRYGSSVVMVLHDTPTSTVRVFIPRRYGSLITEYDMTNINTRAVALNLVFAEHVLQLTHTFYPSSNKCNMSSVRHVFYLLHFSSDMSYHLQETWESERYSMARPRTCRPNHRPPHGISSHTLQGAGDNGGFHTYFVSAQVMFYLGTFTTFVAGVFNSYRAITLSIAIHDTLLQTLFQRGGSNYPTFTWTDITSG
jgi:hypothetical protein